MTLSHYCTVAWVTRPERPKGVKDVIKQAEGPQQASTSSIIYILYIYFVCAAQNTPQHTHVFVKKALILFLASDPFFWRNAEKCNQNDLI